MTIPKFLADICLDEIEDRGALAYIHDTWPSDHAYRRGIGFARFEGMLKLGSTGVGDRES